MTNLLLRKYVRRQELSDKELQDFFMRHGIRVLDTNKKAYRRRVLHPKYFTSATDMNVVEALNIETLTEPVYTIEITLDELEGMAKFEDQIFNKMANRGHYDLFTYIMEQKEKEKELRDRYTAVRKAYEHYSTMLKLAAGGDLDL
jgi:hypothetical protein